MPAYAKNLLPWSVVSRPLEGEAPTIDLAVGYSSSNTSPILKLFLSRIEELTDPISSDGRSISRSGSATAKSERHPSYRQGVPAKSPSHKNR